jgi:hypothetical protein
MPESMSAELFIQKLNDYRSPNEQKKSERALEAGGEVVAFQAKSDLIDAELTDKHRQHFCPSAAPRRRSRDGHGR